MPARVPAVLPNSCRMMLTAPAQQLSRNPTRVMWKLLWLLLAALLQRVSSSACCSSTPLIRGIGGAVVVLAASDQGAGEVETPFEGVAKLVLVFERRFLDAHVWVTAPESHHTPHFPSHQPTHPSTNL